MDMILSLFRSLALVGSTAFSRPYCHLLLLLSYPYALPLLLSHLYLLFLSPLGSFVSSRCHPSSSSISVVRHCWERERDRAREKERRRERERACVCVETALSLSCGQMEDGAAATSLLLFCSACHWLKGIVFFILSVSTSIYFPLSKLTSICDGVSKKKD